MIVVVLFTLLLLTIILASTVQMGLSSRRSTADQTATLATQYAAESAVNIARAELRDIQTMLSSDTINVNNGNGGVVPMSNIVVDRNIALSALDKAAQDFCGTTADMTNGTAWVKSGPDDSIRTCDRNDANLPQRVDFSPSVMALYVNRAAYNRLPENRRPTAQELADTNKLTAWWTKRFEEQTIDEQVKYKLTPLKVQKIGSARYRFYLGLETFKVKGKGPKAERVMNGTRATDGEWWFEIYRPNMLENMMLIDAQDPNIQVATSDPDNSNQSIYITNQQLQGPVHTNGRFTFLGSSTASFTGSLTSSGRVFNSKGVATGEVAPGFFVANSIGASQNFKTGANNNAIIEELPDIGGSSVKSNVKSALESGDLKKVDFRATPYDLPSNDINQKKQAEQQGLVLAGLDSAPDIELFAGDATGNALTTYNTAQRKWTEPVPTYQYIVQCNLQLVTTIPKRCDFNGPNTTVYRVQKSANGKTDLYKRNADGTWPTLAQRFDFNGVIFAGVDNKDVKVSVRGPSRLGNSTEKDLSKVPPALASFSKLNITGNNHMVINGDLTMSETPCPFGEKTCKSKPSNVLGMYTPTGNISVGSDAPNNVNLHGAFMASQGTITVDDYTNQDIGYRGDVNLIGSMIMGQYGAFGQASASGPVSGYGRNFNFDPRFTSSVTPPDFPVSQNWAVRDGRSEQRRLDSLIWKQDKAGTF